MRKNVMEILGCLVVVGILMSVVPAVMAEGTQDRSTEIPDDYVLSSGKATETADESASAESLTIPSTIRVFITETGEIEEVDFKDYVKNVLPNEWIASWDMEALKAGAMAVKTYGWYWTINQKYPGQGYDVRDNESDQIYKPGSSHPRTDQAVDDTWNWIMTRDGEIFQAQYIAGTPGDPDPPEGYEGRMSQWGTQYWAEEGKDWQWMLYYYYDPIGLGGVEPGWPAGKNNICKNPGDGFMDFEGGMDGQKIESTVPGMEFITSEGLDWVYGDIRTGEYNVYPYGHQGYECNDNFFAWLGPTGDWGRINFTEGTATYLSVLVSTYSGVKLDAYDADGNFLATSGWAEDNLHTRTFTRLTVDAPGMAYVIVHDTGNYWLIDDTCTDVSPECRIDVPYFNQCDEPWGSRSYDHMEATKYYTTDDYKAKGTICNWGCALTSSVMILNYYGIETDPLELNDWLEDHHGYDNEGNLNWPAIQDYSDGVISYNGRADRDDSILNSDLCNQRPVILRVPNHYVVATGKTKVDDTDTWSINDPGYRSRTTLLDYDNSYSSMKRYGPAREDNSAMMMRAYSPVEVYIIDPQGRRLGIDPITEEEFDEIPNGAYYIEEPIPSLSESKVLEVLKPMDGDYTIKVIGTDIGPYTLDYYGYNKLGDLSGVEIFTGEITPDEVQEYEVSYSSTETALPVADANGPYTGFVESPITFNGTGSYDPDGTIVSYEWDLDDDGEFDDATGPTPSKTWNTTYSGNISLKVTDNDGATDIDTTTLTVAPLVPARVPTLTPIGLVALVGLLSIIGISKIRRRKN
jgi:hypothetical protein